MAAHARRLGTSRDDPSASPTSGRSQFDLSSGAATAVVFLSIVLCFILLCTYCRCARQRAMASARGSRATRHGFPGVLLRPADGSALPVVRYASAGAGAKKLQQPERDCPVCLEAFGDDERNSCPGVRPRLPRPLHRPVARRAQLLPRLPVRCGLLLRRRRRPGCRRRRRRRRPGGRPGARGCHDRSNKRRGGRREARAGDCEGRWVMMRTCLRLQQKSGPAAACFKFKVQFSSQAMFQVSTKRSMLLHLNIGFYQLNRTLTESASAKCIRKAACLMQFIDLESTGCKPENTRQNLGTPDPDYT